MDIKIFLIKDFLIKSKLDCLAAQSDLTIGRNIFFSSEAQSDSPILRHLWGSRSAPLRFYEKTFIFDIEIRCVPNA